MKQFIMKLGVPNKNGRIYSAETMQRAIDAYADKPCFGTFGAAVEVEMQDVTHKFENLRIEGDELFGDLTFYIIPGAMQDAILAFRPAGIGELRQAETGLEVVNYTLVSINAMSIYEAA